MNNTIRNAIISRDGLVCQYCGVDVVVGKTIGSNVLVIEHIAGRSNDPSNLCVSCRRCNSMKHRRTAREWLLDTEKEIEAIVELLDRRNKINTLLSREYIGKKS